MSDLNEFIEGQKEKFIKKYQNRVRVYTYERPWSYGKKTVQTTIPGVDLEEMWKDIDQSLQAAFELGRKENTKEICLRCGEEKKFIRKERWICSHFGTVYKRHMFK